MGGCHRPADPYRDGAHVRLFRPGLRARRQHPGRRLKEWQGYRALGGGHGKASQFPTGEDIYALLPAGGPAGIAERDGSRLAGGHGPGIVADPRQAVRRGRMGAGAGLLTGRQAAGLGRTGRDGAAVGHGHRQGVAAPRAPGGPGRRLFAGRQAAGLGRLAQRRPPLGGARRRGRLAGAGHQAWAQQVLFHPDGKSLLSAGADNTVRFWDLGSGREVRRLDAWYGRIAVSPDGRTLATAGDGRAAWRLWDLKTGRLSRAGQSAPWQRLPGVRPGRQTVRHGERRPGAPWNVAGGQEVRAFSPGPDVLVRSLAFSPDGRRVVSGDNGGAVRLWDATLGAADASLQGP